MGQRLNIHIRLGEKEIMNSYFHWSAYSHASAEMVSSIISKLTEMMEDDGLEICDFATLKYSKQLKYASAALHRVGAGFTDEEIDKIIKTLPKDDHCEITFNRAIDRNEGFIGITEDTRDSYTHWEEGGVIIDLESGKIDFDVYFRDSADEYKEYMCDPEYCDKVKSFKKNNSISDSKNIDGICKSCTDFHNLTRIDEKDLINLNSLDICDIDCLIDFIEKYEDGVIYNHDGVDYVIYWIE